MSKRTIQQWLQESTKQLQDVSISSARLDCLLLLEHVLHQDRASLLAHPDQLVTLAQLNTLEDLLKKRIQHIPIAYLRGYAEFYGRQFIVTSDVLVPRPESEAMLELLTELDDTASRSTILDIGTGSGALAVSAKLLFPSAEVYAIDVDDNCLAVARKNAEVHKVNILTRKSNLLTALDIASMASPVIVLANLPYVPLVYPVNQAAKHEPALALYGGDDGLDLYRALWEQISSLKTKPAALICESLSSQHTLMVSLAKNAGYTLTKTSGLQQLFAPAKLS